VSRSDATDDNYVVRVPRRPLFVVLAVVLTSLVSACRVDVRVDVYAEDSGAGSIEVTVDLDNAAVTLVPGLPEDLRVDDLIASGWTIEGPTQVNSGGVRVVMRYAFESPAEANHALAQLNGPNGPLLNAQLKRTVEGRDVSTTLDATLQFIGGVEAFSDAELSDLIGSTPWSSTAAKIGVDPMQSVSVTLVAHLPGEIRKSTGTAAEGGVIWTAPLDGTAQTVVIGTVESKVDGGAWKTVAQVVAFVLGAWLIIMGLLIIAVMFARRRKGVATPLRRRPARDDTTEE